MMKRYPNIDLEMTDDPEKLNELGIDYWEKGLLEEAIEFFEKALKINPNYKTAKINLENAIKKFEED